MSKAKVLEILETHRIEIEIERTWVELNSPEDKVFASTSNHCISLPVVGATPWKLLLNELNLGILECSSDNCDDYFNH